MKTIKARIPEVISYFFILLFCYASISKILDFENFQAQISQSPLLSSYAGVISYLTIISELIIVGLLLFPKTRIKGLYCSLGIMSSFTIYIYLILNYSEFVPCSCGGILERMDWNTHLIFNVACVIILSLAIISEEIKRENKFFRYFTRLTLVILISSGAVILLYLRSEYIIKEDNNFTRRYIPHSVELQKVLNLDYSSLYFIGHDSDYIILGNKATPLNITVVKKDLSTYSIFKIPLDFKSHQFKNIKVTWKSPFYYIFDGTVPIVYKGRLFSKDSLQVVNYRTMYFDQLNILSDSSLIFRSQSSLNSNFVIGYYKHQNIDLAYDILGTKNKGYIENDGILISSNDRKTSVYLYYYKNQFVSISNNNTGNTTNVFKLISFNKSKKTEFLQLPDGTRKIKNPNDLTVKNGYIYKDILFVVTNAKGQYETSRQWKLSSTIDLYRINHQYYVGSLLIPNRNRERVRESMVTDNYLYTLIGNEIVKYRIAQAVKNNFTGKAEDLE